MKATAQMKQDNVIYTYIPITLEAFQTMIDQQNQQIAVNQNVLFKKLSDDTFALLSSTDNSQNENIVFNVIKHADESSAINSVDVNVSDNINDDMEVTENIQMNNLIISSDINATPRRSSQAKGNTESITCDICGKAFDKNATYRKHLEVHKNMKKYKCEHCFESYNVEDNFKLHMAIHEKGQPTCPLCSRKFQRLASLKSHLLLHQVEETFSCKECLAEFEDEEEYNVHVSRHGEVKIEIKPESAAFICSYCNYVFEDSKEYKEHVSFHIKIKKLVLTSKRTKRRNHGNKEYPHKCNVCGKSFPKSCLLERHNRIHSGERPFACTKCNKAFAQKCTLQIHLFKHSGIKPYKCTLCPAEYFQKGNLRVHVEKTHTAPPNEKLFKCTQCTCVFRKVASLNAHITKVHGGAKPVDELSISSLRDQLTKLQQITGEAKNVKEPPVISADSIKNIEILDQVTNSNETFVKLADSSVEGSLRRYLVKQRKIGNIKWFICSYCTKEFKKPSDLIRHIRVHTREKPYKCSNCSQSFSLKSTLISHMNTHFSKREYQCVHCSKMFTSARTLNVHYRKHDKNNSRQIFHFKCHTCNKMFNSITKAELHRNLHKASNSIGTNINDVQVVLKQPMLETANGLLPVPAPKSRLPSSNTEECKNRPYKCGVCNAAFMKPDHVKRHMLIHSGEKNFKCDICTKSFYTSYALKEHIQLHSNVKNYICKFCNKRFSTHILLKRHEVKHSNVRPYVCPYCKKRFKTVTMCRKHIRNVHHRDINIEIQALIETGELTNDNNGDKPKIIDLSDSLSDNPFGLNVVEEPFNSINGNDTSAHVPTIVNSTISTKHSVQTQTVIKKSKTSMKRRSRKRKTNKSDSDVVLNLGLQEPTINNPITQVGVGESQDKLSIDLINQLIANSQLYVDKSGNYRLAAGDAVIEKEATSGSQEDNTTTYPTLFISYDDLQSVSSNLCNSLLPHIKLEGNDPILMSAINEPQESNILFMDPTLAQSSEYQSDSQNFEAFNSVIFNTNMSVGDFNLNATNLNITLPNVSSAVTNINERISESESQVILPALEDDISDKTDLTEGAGRFLMKTNSESVVDHSRVIPPNENVGLSDSLVITLNNDDLKSNELNYFPNITFNLSNNGNSVSVNNSLVSLQENIRSIISCSLCKTEFNTIQDLLRHPCMNVDYLAKEIKNMCAKDVNLRKSPERLSNAEEDQLDTAIIADFNEQLETTQVEIENELPATIMKDTASNKDYRCGNCQKSFSTEAKILKHMTVIHGSTKTKKNMLFNKSIDKDKKIENTCQFCLKLFKKPSDLKRHIRTHTGEKPYACNTCDKRFSLKSTLQSHMRTHNPTGSKDFLCMVCNMNYSCKASLKTHMLIHTGVRPYLCRSCPLKFRTSAHRKAHETNHIKKIHACKSGENKTRAPAKAVSNYVESIFLTNKDEQTEGASNQDMVNNNLQSDNQILEVDPSLNISEPIDSLQLQTSGWLLEDGTVDMLATSLIQLAKEVAADNENVSVAENSSSIKECNKSRNFECDVCQKRYLSKAVLRKHQKIHKQGFKCGKCGKQFQSEDLLTKHSKLHLGYRPFSCLLCANSFSEEGSLKTHMKRIHNS